MRRDAMLDVHQGNKPQRNSIYSTSSNHQQCVCASCMHAQDDHDQYLIGWRFTMSAGLKSQFCPGPAHLWLLHPAAPIQLMLAMQEPALFYARFLAYNMRAAGAAAGCAGSECFSKEKSIVAEKMVNICGYMDVASRTRAICQIARRTVLLTSAAVERMLTDLPVLTLRSTWLHRRPHLDPRPGAIVRCGQLTPPPVMHVR